MAPSLQQRIWGGSAVVTVAALLLFFFIADRSFRGTVRTEVEQNVRTGLTLATQVRASHFDELIGTASALAQDARLKAAVDTGDPATIEQILREDLAESDVDWMAVLDVDGAPRAGTSEGGMDRLHSSDHLLRDARFYDTGDLRVGPEGLVDVAASPILFGSVPMGILLAGRRVDSTAIRDIETYARQRVAILADGRVEVRGALGDDILRRNPSPWENEVTELRVGGEAFLGIEAPIVDADGRTVASMLVFQSLDEALAPARRLRLTLLGVAALSLGLAFLLGLVLARQVTAPVNRLLEDAHRVGEGDLDSPILPVRSDEIGKLAEGFDQMRESLRGAQEELIRFERLSAVGRMASSIVHDFANPLTSIRMHAELLAVDDDPARLVTSVGEITQQVDRMNAMMREVLEYARGHHSLDPQEVEVGTWLAEIERFWRPLLLDHGVVLRMQCGYRGPWTFDPERLRRVLDNLIKNALEALEPGGTIVVRVARREDALSVEVADDGRGVPPELHDTLFQPFTTHGKQDGTGLGLAICRSVVERHGGAIDFASSRVGTTFTIRIPEDREECADVA